MGIIEVPDYYNDIEAIKVHLHSQEFNQKLFCEIFHSQTYYSEL